MCTPMHGAKEFAVGADLFPVIPTRAATLAEKAWNRAIRPAARRSL
jgi:hypothetical protein